MNYINNLGYLFKTSDGDKVKVRFSLSYSGLISTVHVWFERDRERRAMKRLTSALLKDIGLTEEARLTEVSKPFWKA